MKKLFDGFRPLEAEELIEWVGGATKSKSTTSKVYKSPKGLTSAPSTKPKPKPPKTITVSSISSVPSKKKPRKIKNTSSVSSKSRSKPNPKPNPKPEIPSAVLPAAPVSKGRREVQVSLAPKSSKESTFIPPTPNPIPLPQDKPESEMVLASLAPTTIPESVMNPENPKDREVPEAPGEVENSKVLGEPRGFHLTQEVLDTQPLGEVLDALYLNGEEGGYCFVGALLQTYVDNGAELDVTSLVKVMKSAATNEAWNGNPVVQSNGYVNDPDQFLALAARVLHVEPLSTGDTKYREATLRFALDADNRNTPGALNFSNAQTVVDSFREQAFPGQEGNGNVIMELRKGSLTHFVSLSNWDVASMIDPHGGNSRSDWSVASLRVLN